MKDIVLFSFLVLLVLVFRNSWLEAYDSIFSTLPIFLLVGLYAVSARNYKKWFVAFPILIILVFGLIGFYFIVKQPDRLPVFIGMMCFLISKIYFLSNLRKVNGYFKLHDLKSVLSLLFIGALFMLFFIFLLLNEVELLYLIPIFVYVIVDTLTVYSLTKVIDNERHISIGVMAIIFQIGFDIVCAFSIFLPLIKDNYNSSLLVGYFAYFFSARYLFLRSR